jgi:hypothetical protein
MPVFSCVPTGRRRFFFDSFPAINRRATIGRSLWDNRLATIYQRYFNAYAPAPFRRGSPARRGISPGGRGKSERDLKASDKAQFSTLLTIALYYLKGIVRRNGGLVWHERSLLAGVSTD